MKAVYDEILTEMYESGLFRLNKQNRVEFCQRWNGHLYVPANWHLCGKDDGKGYLYISYGQARVKEHRLVYMLHHKLRDLAGFEINHLNGDTLDNSIENLELCKPSRQSKHAFDTGLNWSRGVDHSLAKLDDQKVRDIRRRCANGETYSALAREYGVTLRSIKLAYKRETWAHVK